MSLYQITPEEGTKRFVSLWEPYADKETGAITQEGFLLFYHDLSLALPSDQHFDRTMAITWNLR